MEIDSATYVQKSTSAPPNPQQTLSSSNPQAKSKSKPRRPATQITTTIRDLPWTYLHLTLLPSNPTTVGVARAPPVDAITARTHLTSALTQFLGLHGSAIAVDILKTEGREVWIRVPRPDAGVVVEATSGWVAPGDGAAWRVNGRAEWLGALVAGNCSDLFR